MIGPHEEGTKNILEFAVDHKKMKKFIYTSSIASMVAGNYEERTVKGTDEINENSTADIYAKSKHRAEKVMKDF